MSLLGHSSSKVRVQYYVYLQNLPARYVDSDIFPDVLLREEVREGLLELELHRAQGYCLFGFGSKLLCSKF